MNNVNYTTSWTAASNSAFPTKCDMDSSVGQLILQLAKHSLNDNETVLPFTNQRIKVLKDKGISLTDKLSKDQMKHIFSELEAFNLISQISQREKKQMTESDMAGHILDFSTLSKKDLKAKTNALTDSLKTIEFEAREQIYLQEHNFRETLKLIKKTIPDIRKKEMLRHFHRELQQSAQTASEIARIATHHIKNVQLNALNMFRAMEERRERLTTLVKKYNDLKVRPDFIESKTNATTWEMFERLHWDECNFKPYLVNYQEVKDDWCVSQMKSSAIGMLIEQFNEENENIQEIIEDLYSIKTVTEEEMQVVQYFMRCPTHLYLYEDAMTSSSEFYKRYLKPYIEQRDKILQEIKNKHTNQ